MFCLWFSRVQGPLLFNYVCQMESYSETLVLVYMRQLVNALQWLHKRNIAHLDIKPENVMVNTICATSDLTEFTSPSSASIKQKHMLKLIDFGDAVGAINRNIVLPPSNLEFSAPEMVIGQTLNPSTDSWCFGILLYVFLSGVSPFLDDSIEETTSNILKCDFSFPDEYFHEISNDAKNLLRRLLVLQGTSRATMNECQMSAWFTQVNFIDVQKRNWICNEITVFVCLFNRNHRLRRYQRRSWKLSTKDECGTPCQCFRQTSRRLNLILGLWQYV